MYIDKEKALSNLQKTFSNFIDYVNNDIEKVTLQDFNSEETMLVIIDMVNGFVREGVLSSPFVDNISKKLSLFAKNCEDLNIPIIAYADTHDSNCKEFKSFPVHCVKNTYEAELIDELKSIKSIMKVEKNSTNSFIAKNPLELADRNIKNILVVGCVTDICVRDFSKTFNKYLDDKNIDANVFLIENLVETYDIEGYHDRQMEHLLALYDMKSSGIKIVNMKL
ncbi:cysteine hydrolase [Sedimentibacter sp. zth1]|uniref:cysteine hydrolase family protein n=1 Tax=Sedimentibacter sp. zth1 TaxID=2816908 RepID=UPI001A91B4D2|nr:isochorismatase family cysteine hydrolase [Sedimentibacter sp. zth1]QSX07212.1 cysteine hydrolase [Sedimentibacter sp. zth1]